MEQRNEKFDVVIIGGGAAGITAAISCKKHYPAKSVCILDRTFALGRKILVSGAGRSNITNINLKETYKSRFYGSQEFIGAVFEQFNYEDILAFFTDLGIETYVEKKTRIGKVFPVTDQARSVTTLLEDELNRLGVKIFLNEECKTLNKTNTGFSLITNNHTFTADYVILAAGGMTYPALGSDGSGYTLAKSLGHHIIEPIPAALPLTSKNPLSQELQGVKMEIEVTAVVENHATKTRSDDVMFTQYGLSGPAIMNVSREISLHFNREHKSNAYVLLNFFAGKTKEDARATMESRWQKRPDQSIEKSFFGFMPIKVPVVLLKTINIDPQTPVNKLSESQKEQIISQFTAYKAPVSGTRGWNEAEFTSGGITTDEVKSGTLESKLSGHLYFCGEILDVDGDIGGFNLSWAWSSGWVAGQLK